MATCNLSALLKDACTNGFSCLDEKAYRSIVLELLCNLSQSSGTPATGGGITTRINNPITQFGVDYTNTTGKPMFITGTVQIENDPNPPGPSFITIEDVPNSVTFALIQNTFQTGSLFQFTGSFGIWILPGKSVRIVNNSDLLLHNSIVMTYAWY